MWRSVRVTALTGVAAAAFPSTANHLRASGGCFSILPQKFYGFLLLEMVAIFSAPPGPRCLVRLISQISQCEMDCCISRLNCPPQLKALCQ